MMKVACTLLLLAGCCHQGPAAMVSQGDIAATGLTVLDKRCELNCALTLAIHQLPSRTSIELELKLANASHDQMLWVSSSPRIAAGFGHRRVAEIELHMLDHNGREVLERCLEFGSHDGEGSYATLGPGQAVTIKYSMHPGCYLLDPGEILNVVATYGPVEGRPENPIGTSVFDQSVSTHSWQQIVVPTEWKR